MASPNSPSLTCIGPAWLQVVVTDHERPGGAGGAKKVIGLAVVGLDTSGLLSEGEGGEGGEGGSGSLRVREVWLPVQTRITQELANLLSDRSDFSPSVFF